MKNIIVPIVPRKMSFELAKHNTQDWCCNDLIMSAYMNGISLALPLGEHFFIKSIRQFEADVSDPHLKDDLKRFVAQEAIHSRQHQIYNELLIRDGYEIKAIEDHTQQLLNEEWEKSTPLERLAFTIALEHITHVLGDQILSHSERLADWNAEFRAFWLWHAAEEIEHKAVCFDLYQQLGGTYLMRCKALVTATSRMLSVFLKSQHQLMEQNCRMRGLKMLSKSQITKTNIAFTFGKNGILRGCQTAYSEWFMPNYHPWKHDNRQELNNWKANSLPLNHVADLKV